MTVKTTLSFTDRHHKFLKKKVKEGVFASSSSVVANAIEAMIQEEEARKIALAVMADEIQARMTAPLSDDLVDIESVFAKVRARVSA